MVDYTPINPLANFDWNAMQEAEDSAIKRQSLRMENTIRAMEIKRAQEEIAGQKAWEQSNRNYINSLAKEQPAKEGLPDNYLLAKNAPAAPLLNNPGAPAVPAVPGQQYDLMTAIEQFRRANPQFADFAQAKEEQALKMATLKSENETRGKPATYQDENGDFHRTTAGTQEEKDFKAKGWEYVGANPPKITARKSEKYDPIASSMFSKMFYDLSPSQQAQVIKAGDTEKLTGKTLSPEAVDEMLTRWVKDPKIQLGMRGTEGYIQLANARPEFEKKHHLTPEKVVQIQSQYSADQKSLQNLQKLADRSEQAGVQFTAMKDYLKAAVEALNNGDFAVFNRIKNAWARATGDPRANVADIYNASSGREWMKQVTNSFASIAELSVGAQDKVDKMLSVDFAPDVSKGVLEAVENEVDATKKSYQTQIDKINARMELPIDEYGEKIERTEKANPLPQPEPQGKQLPKKGDVVKGYVFLGGNPADKTRWKKVSQ